MSNTLYFLTSWQINQKHWSDLFFPAPILRANPAKSEFTAGEPVSFQCIYFLPNACNKYRYHFDTLLVKALMKSDSSHWPFKSIKPEFSGSLTCDCVLDAGTTPKSNVVSFTVGKLTILIPFQSPRQKYPLPKCSGKQDRPRTNKAISMMCGKSPRSDVEI